MNQSSSVSNTAQFQDIPKTFTGRFLRSKKSSLSGRGSLTLESGALVLQGKTRRHFWAGCEICHRIELQHIFNVMRCNDVVTFQLEIPLGTQTEFRFQADTDEHANALLQALPTRYTPEFMQDLSERNSFAQQLLQCSPHAWVTPLLVSLNVLVFLLMAASGVGFFSSNGRLALAWGTNFSPFTLGGQWWRLLTCLFIHFGILHLGFNMLALYSVGKLVERLYGSIYFLVLYLMAGLTGSLVSLIWHPVVNSAGASGAIFGVFGALLVYVLNPRHGVPRSLMQEHRKSIGACILYNLVFGATVPGIDNAAHLGGLIGGMLMGLALARPLLPIRHFFTLQLLRGLCVAFLLPGLAFAYLLATK